MNAVSEIGFLTLGLKTFSMLFIVLALLVFVLYTMKKFLFRRGIESESLIKIVSSLHLSPKERIQVVEIMGEKIVLGVTPGNITFLTKLSGTCKTEKEQSEADQGHEIM